MPVTEVLASGLALPVALRTRPGGDTVVVAQRRGALVSVDTTTADVTPLTTAPGWIQTFDLSPDGAVAYAGGSVLGLVAVPLDGTPAGRLMRRPGRPGAVLATSDGAALLVAEGRRPGRLFRLGLTPRRGDVIGRGWPTARGLLVRQDTGTTLVADAADGGRLVTTDGTVVCHGLGRPVDAAWRTADERYVVVADAAGRRVVQVDLEHPGDVPATLADGLGRLWAARPLPDGRLAVGSDDTILLVDAPSPAPAAVELHVPAGQLFLGGWVRVGVVLNDPAISFDDLDFVVDPQIAGEHVSASRDNSFDPQAPTIVLIAGWLAGRHTLTAVRRSDGTAVGAAEFDVLDTWTDRRWGPARAFVGTAEGGADAGTWGGPDSGDHTLPQSVNVPHATGTYRVGVVLVETAQAGAQFPANVAPIITALRNELVDGVTIGGVTRSVADYFAQASGGRFAVDFIGPVGPVALPNGWGSYFTMNAQNQWVYNDDTDAIVLAEIVRRNQDAVAAGDPPLLDLSQLDSVLYVVRSRPAMGVTPRLGVWPRASTTKISQIIGTIDLGFATFTFRRPLARIFMPDDWATADPTREMHETVAHELGHNLGLIDQYNKSYAGDIAARITGGPEPAAAVAPAASNPTGATGGSWELMTWEQNLPLPSAAHRLMLGWLRPEHVRLFNFGVTGAVDQQVTLQAAGSGTVPAGRFGAAEIRIEEGLNYYLEYRPTIAGRTVDTAVPEASTVVMTEALTRTPQPTDRAQILLVGDDPDLVVEQGSFLAGEDYREQDDSSPAFEQEFIVDVVDTTADTATVRVRYAPGERPDPAITPWVPANNWQSPDFEVSNGRSMADPAFRNIPWEGQPNTLRVRVHNYGSSDAHDVRVRFAAKDFTLQGGAETALGEDVGTIPAGANRVFEAPRRWWPAVVHVPFGTFTYQQHSCVTATIDPFLDPVSGVWEVTPENNVAQSNYTWMASTVSSPATREITAVVVDNPWPVPAVMSVAVHQPHPLFRVYLDHAWVRLEPGEQQRVLVMLESVLGDERLAPLVEDFRHGERRIETTLRLSMYGDDWSSCAPTLLGGAAILGMTGTGTTFESFDTEGGLASGRVVETGTGRPVSGDVIVAVNPTDPDDDREPLVRPGELDDGFFRVEHGRTEPGRWSFTAFYLGRFPWTPCESETLRP